MKGPIVTPVLSEQELEQWLEKSNNMLLIADLHKSWSDNCITLVPTFEQIQMTTVNCDKRVAFLSLEIPKFAKTFPALHEEDSTKKIDLNSIGCSPLFAAIRNRKVVSTIEMANVPKLLSVIQTHLPETIESNDDDSAEQ